MTRGDRMHHERRVYARRQRRTPGYVAKHAGKTPGRYCSDPACCGNPRRRGEVTRQERLAPPPVDTRDVDTVDAAELRALSCAAPWRCARELTT